MRTRRTFSSSNPAASSHRSVLLHEAVAALDIQEGDTVVDATLGGAGHATQIVERLGRGGLFIGFDLDSDAISRAEVALKDARPQIVLINANFKNLHGELSARDVLKIDKALFDLGWSSDQLDAGRGFSFLKDEPLLMTYVKDGEKSLINARTIVNEWEEQSLADIIYGWGEERYSRRIAKAIVAAREKKPIETSHALAEIIRQAVPPAYARGRIHPATRTFQAIRIAVNDELGAIDRGLRNAWDMLKPGGRIAVITFHSIEDRVVKRLFLEFSHGGKGIRVTKKPTAPSEEEILNNPRARSAKLRVIEKNRINYDQNNSKNEQVPAEHPAGDAAV